MQLSDGKAVGEDWNWDAYFLMRHHSAPTRLLDWSDGALIVLHFATQRREEDDLNDAVVYVLEPDLLKAQLNSLADAKIAEAKWKLHVANNPAEGFKEDEVESSYLPADEGELAKLYPPAPPMVLDFPHLTRRVAAQRSRFVVFGTDACWLVSRLGQTEDFPIKEIIIDGQSKKRIRLQLRDGGVTESVIFPDLDGLGREMNQLFWEWR